jgi:uncharacterized protein
LCVKLAINTSAMADTLYNFPLFPIGVIILPGEIQPLHIFEPRYKQLIKDMEDSKGIFGIPYFVNGRLCHFGSAVQIHKILAVSPTGEMDLLVRGISIFKTKHIEEQLPGKLYGGGTVTILNDLNSYASEVMVTRFLVYRRQLEKINKSETGAVPQIERMRILDIAGQMPLEVDEKYTLIKLDHHTKREQFLLEKLEFLSLINKKLEEVGYRFYLN